MKHANIKVVGAPQIGVLTTYESKLPERIIKLAEELGKELAKKGCIVITGGNGGLMRVVSKAVVEYGGLVVGVLSDELAKVGEEHPLYNPYMTVKIRTGMNYDARSVIIVESSDALIVLAGGAGTLTEVCMAYNRRKPIVVIEGSGLIADRIKEKFPNGYIDHRKKTKILFAKNPKEAVELALTALKQQCNLKANH